MNTATSIGGHILDLVFSNKDSDLIQELNVDEVCCLSPVHKLVTFKIPFISESRISKVINYRLKRNFEPELLITSITSEIILKKYENCEHNHERKEECILCFSGLYNDIAREKYDEMCPILEKEIVVVDNAPWFNATTLRAKKDKKKK